MARGFMGKLLFVDLSTGKTEEEMPEEKLYRNFIGGYGMGARIIYSRQKAGIDPLGPESVFGLATGVLTGTPTPFGSRYVAVGKSPLTGTWGDANSGGDFGPHLKFAGYDAVFFTGISPKPVYLLIDNGEVEIRDAAHLWRRDSFETEDILISELGKDVHVACIGPSGEKLALISCIMNNKGRAAGRSGLGAVMGSKRLKAVVVRGSQKVPVANNDRIRELRRKYLAEMANPETEDFRKYGTARAVHVAAHNGDTPVKNWDGVGVDEFPNAIAVSRDNVIANMEKRYACWHCPIGCGGEMKEGRGTYKYAAGAHKPEYETLASFGAMCLNDDVESIIKANDICNRYGLDTISAGAAVSFAIECFEKGLISREDTGGIELNWGNHAAIVAMTEKLAKREGFGAILAEGIKIAAERIGKGAEQFAMHIQGQEVAMHDPRLATRWAISYKLDATPGRHTQGWERFAPRGLEMPPEENIGERHKIASNLVHVLNASGICLMGPMRLSAGFIPDFMSAVTGWDWSMDDILLAGERIANIRTSFNIREGINLVKPNVPNRILGRPPQKTGPIAGKSVDIELMVENYLKAADWDLTTGKPSKRKLHQLELNDVAQDLWPD